MFKFIDDMQLGLVIEKGGGNPVAHRSLLKVLLNPILRGFGYQIASLIESEPKIKFIKYEIIPCYYPSEEDREVSKEAKRVKPFKWSWKYTGRISSIIKERTII